MTHVVVKADSSPNTEYVVPLGFVTETLAGTIRLHCRKADLEKMDPFIQTTVIKEKVPEMVYGYGEMYGAGSCYYLPYVTPEMTVYEPMENRQIPTGELAVRRGTRVEATDGYVGRVDEFVINPRNGQITHMVMREGHLWGKKDVIIPLSAIGDNPRMDTVTLKIDKAQIESLPTFPLNRRWA